MESVLAHCIILPQDGERAIGIFGVYSFGALYFFSGGVKAVFPFVEVAARLDNGLEVAPIPVENEGSEGRNIV